ncbi:unnamed protein product [Eruca vesicaria subsp. sativa]|uniref:PUM-HD domain-containing protein n=1 Tax=Eruca vesicaria subsp. sativa TaxID=29727 RepID=A0ABC8KQ01_ERUVS|nr:unnamed protein product [Eruca vesicaria subsp. sativa]
MAITQHGSKYLQKILQDGTSLEAMVVIFNEVIHHLVKLMRNPFGNYLVQKLLDVCNEEQRTNIIRIVTSPRTLFVQISLEAYGTRVVQRLVESIKTTEQILLVTSALRVGFLSLATDFIYEEATRFCIDIATHNYGCPMLRTCVAYSTGQQRETITEELRSAIHYRNERFSSELKGHYEELSTQKFSSHVVQRCLTHYPESRPQIVNELISVPRFDLLVQDPYAKFVIQAALSVTEGSLHDMLVTVHSNLRKSP